MAIVITRHTAIKLVELIIVCVMVALFLSDKAYGLDLRSKNYFLGAGTTLGYLIILVGVFAGGLMGTPVNRRVDLFYCLIGCALFIAIGAISLGNHSGNLLGWLAIVEGVVFLVDAVLVFRNEP